METAARTKVIDLTRHSAFAPAPKIPAHVDYWDCLASKLVEISGTTAHARLTYAALMVLQAQQQGETVAWIQPLGGGLYPPDLNAMGIDLAALVVIHVPPQAGAFGIPRAAEILLQSGGFGLVIMDLLAGVPPSGMTWQGRLLSLLRRHESSVVMLTHKGRETESVGALGAWRIEPQRRQLDDLFVIEPTILKNKCGLPWPHSSTPYRGPWGAT